MTSPEERFSALFEATHVALLGYAVRRVSDPSDAADVVAETYVVAWRRLEDVPPGDEARAWLFGVARRVLANHYRGERRRHALADRLRDSLDHVVEPEEPREPSVVERAVDRLGDSDRELLRLLAWEELAREEIAVVMGLSRAAVRVRLHRARARLREAMRQVEAELEPIALQRVTTPGADSRPWATATTGTEES